MLANFLMNSSVILGVIEKACRDLQVRLSLVPPCKSHVASILGP